MCILFLFIFFVFMFLSVVVGKLWIMRLNAEAAFLNRLVRRMCLYHSKKEDGEKWR